MLASSGVGSATEPIKREPSMTIVLVHGNPETEAIWDDLVPHLRNHDVVRLSPPGFGSAIPSGFDCSTAAYRDWLAGELEKLAQPIVEHVREQWSLEVVDYDHAGNSAESSDNSW